jgi:hypothetical protein
MTLLFVCMAAKGAQSFFAYQMFQTASFSPRYLRINMEDINKKFKEYRKPCGNIDRLFSAFIGKVNQIILVMPHKRFVLQRVHHRVGAGF